MIDLLPITGESVDTIRVLTPDEIATLQPIFDEQGSTIPDPSLSTFVGVIRDGKVVAFLVLQLILHAEPLWIEQGHSAVLPALVKEAERTILERCGPQYVFLFSPAGRIAQLAQSMGMQLEPWVVLSKLVTPEDHPVIRPLEQLYVETPVGEPPESEEKPDELQA